MEPNTQQTEFDKAVFKATSILIRAELVQRRRRLGYTQGHMAKLIRWGASVIEPFETDPDYDPTTAELASYAHAVRTRIRFTLTDDLGEPDTGRDHA